MAVDQVKNKEDIKQVDTFSKEQLINSNLFRDRVDILTALLKPDKLYTINTVDKKINEFLKGKVN